MEWANEYKVHRQRLRLRCAENLQREFTLVRWGADARVGTPAVAQLAK